VLLIVNKRLSVVLLLCGDKYIEKVLCEQNFGLLVVIFLLFLWKLLILLLMNINVEERVERARGYFLEGYNCAQAVVMAFDDVMAMSPESLAKLAAPFGGGMGRMREVCGTVSGMAMVAGAIQPSADPKNLEERKLNYALVQTFADSFRKENGDIVCRRLLGLEPVVVRAETHMPSERTQEYYRKRPCVEYVACAARIVAEYLAK
jgi:C_GCAxxG_C_C family probable redox protein